MYKGAQVKQVKLNQYIYKQKEKEKENFDVNEVEIPWLIWVQIWLHHLPLNREVKFLPHSTVTGLKDKTGVLS